MSMISFNIAFFAGPSSTTRRVDGRNRADEFDIVDRETGAIVVSEMDDDDRMLNHGRRRSRNVSRTIVTSRREYFYAGRDLPLGPSLGTEVARIPDPGTKLGGFGCAARWHNTCANSARAELRKRRDRATGDSARAPVDPPRRGDCVGEQGLGPSRVHFARRAIRPIPSGPLTRRCAKNTRARIDRAQSKSTGTRSGKTACLSARSLRSFAIKLRRAGTTLVPTRRAPS